MLEETGIELNIINIESFAYATGYYKDWPVEGKNRKVENVIKTNALKHGDKKKSQVKWLNC